VRDAEAVHIGVNLIVSRRRFRARRRGARSFWGALRVSLGARALRVSAFRRLFLRLARLGGALALRRGAAHPAQLATERAGDAHAAHGVHNLRRGEHDAESAKHGVPRDALQGGSPRHGGAASASARGGRARAETDETNATSGSDARERVRGTAVLSVQIRSHLSLKVSLVGRQQRGLLLFPVRVARSAR
jgi:hypothetical protein